MKHMNREMCRRATLAVMSLICLGLAAPGRAQVAGRNKDSALPPVGPGSVIVHSQFGGQIFGFDIDRNGTEGVLSEAHTLSNGNVEAAVETFDEKTGKILKVVSKTETQDDFLTIGIATASVGLVEREHVQGIFVAQRIYQELNPLSANRFTSTWTPPLTKDDIIMGISRDQASPTTAVLAFHNDGNTFSPFVFGSNIGLNTFQPSITLTDPAFDTANFPQVAYDNVTNLAVVAGSDGALGGPPPQIALVDLTLGTVSQFTGLRGPFPFRQGFINGLAIDSEDGIACTTTEVDFRVEFYNLATGVGFAVTLPGATSQLQSGTDVEYDPIHKLFLVAQSVSSTGSGSSIQVYNTKGKLIESLNGFNFSNASNVVFTHIGLNPATRSGYVDGPDSGVTELQSFTY